MALIGAVVFQTVAALGLLAMEVASGTDIREAAERLPEKLATPSMFILMAACGQLAMGLGAIVPAWLSPVPLRARLGLLSAGPSWSVYPLTMLGSLVPLAIGLGFAAALAQVMPGDPSVQILLDNITLAEAVPFVLFIAIVPGVVEELLFRGYIQRRLLERWSPGWAIGVTSVLFALMHVMPHAIVAVLPLGIWLGVVAWRTGSVLPSIFCHAFVNGSLNAWRMAVKFGDIPEPTQWIVVVATLLAGLACFVLSLRFLAGHGNRSFESLGIDAAT